MNNLNQNEEMILNELTIVEYTTSQVGIIRSVI